MNQVRFCTSRTPFLSPTQTRKVDRDRHRLSWLGRVRDLQDYILDVLEVKVRVRWRPGRARNDELPRSTCNRLTEERCVRHRVAKRVDPRLDHRDGIGT